MKKCIAMLLALVMLLTASSLTCFAAEASEAEANNKSEIATDASSQNAYIAYLESVAATHTDATESIVLSADSFSASEGAVEKVGTHTDAAGTTKTGVVKWTGEKGYITYTVNVPANAYYELQLNYCPIAGRGLPLAFGFMVDGEYPYDTIKSTNFHRTWVDAKPEGVHDGNGNIYASEQVESLIFTTEKSMDKTGQIVEPLKVALSAGTHTVTVVVQSGELYLESLVLAAPVKTPGYAEALEQYKANGYKNYSGENDLIIEAERALYKSTSSITPLTDNSDPSVRWYDTTTGESKPSQAFKNITNFIGSTGWQSPNETITWKLNVAESGLYRVAFRFRQNAVINGNSYRSLKIDGVAPFEEAENISFYYGGDWQFQVLQVDGQDAYVYLEAGEHEISMAVTLSNFGEVSREINDVTYEIGNLYLKIRMITGDNIDSGRSYEFFEQIEGFNETLQTNIDRLTHLCDRITEITGQTSGTYIASIKNMRRVMQEMLDNPYTAQKYVSTYYDNYCSLTALIADMAALPLDLDQIIFSAPEGEFDFEMATFWDKTKYSFNRFLVSFMEEYRYSAEGTADKKKLTIWVTWGNDQTQILRSLVKDSFEAEHPDVTVNIQVVGATLVQAILSGSGPDLFLSHPRTEPVNYGMRGALEDLKQFSDFDEVITRFQKSATEPYMLGDACYGLPDTQIFEVVYYRTDIFEELGLTVPKTWEEFRNTAALLQRQNLEVGLPGAGLVNNYATYLLQNGGKLYTDDKKATTLTNGTAVESFVYWTEFYTDLGYAPEFSFYNRFRSGTMPLGIAASSTYTTFSQAAPEITGRWAIAPLPGTLKEDGTIDYTQADTGTACVIPKIAKHKDEAWEFIKWWTSDNIQYRYSTMVEAVLGEVGRVATSNIEAFKRLSWESDDLDVLLESWEDVIGLSEVPGGYYVTRSIYQAFWNVVNLDENPKDMIVKWGKIADSEITRKRREYNLD